MDARENHDETADSANGGKKEERKKSHRFTCEAMNTDFTIFVDAAETDPEQAAGAAQAAFALLDKLEQVLSLFVHSSDVSKINALKVGESHQLTPESLDCLAIAARIAAETERAFDPSAGALTEFWKARGAAHADRCEEEALWRAAWEAHRHGEFTLDPSSREIRCITEGSKLDLGAIGKGYALDEMAKLIEQEWALSRVLLSAGGSTVLALDPPLGKAGWKIGFGGETRLPCLLLSRNALSSTGTQSQPSHLVNPRNGHLVAKTELVRSVASDGATADALSTAFFVMERIEIEEFCSAFPNYTAILVKNDPDGIPESFDIPHACASLNWASPE